jgi:hypothetical protein
MKIETKFNPGDRVFFLSDGKMKCEFINSIKVNVENDFEISVLYFFRYEFNNIASFELKYEHDIFASKEEFINHITGTE